MLDVVRQLRRLLKANASFSLVSAVLMALFADFWAGYVQVFPVWVLYALAAVVLIFGAIVWWVARQWSLNMTYAKIISGLDFAWVLGSVILLLGWGAAMTAAAVIGIGVIAVIVLAFGLRQAKLISHQRLIQGAYIHASH